MKELTSGQFYEMLCEQIGYDTDDKINLQTDIMFFAQLYANEQKQKMLSEMNAQVMSTFAPVV